MERDEIVGRWLECDGRVVGDDACAEIERLIAEEWHEVAGGGWRTLFRDPESGAYWERTYPQGHMHGGGPPAVRRLSEREAEERYGPALGDE